VLKGYPLTPARHDEIRKALEEREAEAANAPEPEISVVTPLLTHRGPDA
jgi:hypothetical protein